MSIASHGQPSRWIPSGPRAAHFEQPMQVSRSMPTVPNGGCCSSGIQYMQASMGQQSTQTGAPAHPVQFSVTTATGAVDFRRTPDRPCDIGSRLFRAAEMKESSFDE